MYSKTINMKASSVFTVKVFNAIKRERTTDTYEVESFGQEAVKSLRKQVGPRASIILKGFKINGVFQTADLRSYWAETVISSPQTPQI